MFKEDNINYRAVRLAGLQPKSSDKINKTTAIPTLEGPLTSQTQKILQAIILNKVDSKFNFLLKLKEKSFLCFLFPFLFFSY